MPSRPGLVPCLSSTFLDETPKHSQQLSLRSFAGNLVLRLYEGFLTSTSRIFGNYTCARYEQSPLAQHSTQIVFVVVVVVIVDCWGCCLLLAFCYFIGCGLCGIAVWCLLFGVCCLSCVVRCVVGGVSGVLSLQPEA